MGFLCKLFGKCNKNEEKIVSSEVRIFAPIDGEIVKLCDVKDETFSKKLLGEGIAINPLKSGALKAPVDGKLVQLFETLHAYIVETKDGVQILTHFGMNTVNLKGEGFKALAKEGDIVKAGDNIVEFDYDFIKDKVETLVTPVVVLESEEYTDTIPLVEEGTVEGGKTEVITVVR